VCARARARCSCGDPALVRALIVSFVRLRRKNFTEKRASRTLYAKSARGFWSGQDEENRTHTFPKLSPVHGPRFSSLLLISRRAITIVTSMQHYQSGGNG
jgi:hypothetical protein